MVNKIELRSGNNFLDMMNFLSLILGPLRILTLVPVKNFFLLEKWDKKSCIHFYLMKKLSIHCRVEDHEHSA